LGVTGANTDWPFDQNPETTAITTVGVIEGGLPILVVQHYIDDHSWAFLCGTTDDTQDARVVAMHEVVGLDASLASVSDLEPGWVARRTAVGEPWSRESM
jgi:hypothetical protein